MKNVWMILVLTFLIGNGRNVSARPVSAIAPGSFSSFKFEVKNNSGKITEDIICDIYGDTLVVGIIPYQVNQFNLIATFVMTSNVIQASVDDVAQQSEISINNFNHPVEYTLTSTSSSRKVSIRLIYTGLPVVYISTQDNKPIVSKEDYLDGQIKIYPNSSGPVFNAPTEIRGRGNSTWEMPKKPYKIKLNTKASLLDMPADKEWVLLANYSDKTLLRTSVAFELSHRLGMAYEPRTKHVELILNGRYVGNYLLSEQIKVAKNRVNIKELKKEDVDDEKKSGGYLMEIDFRKDADFWFETKKNIPFTIKSPEEITPGQLEYIHNYVQQVEDVLFSSSFADPANGYHKYIDINSFIDWYWVNELFKTPDAIFLTSVFIYKDRNGKLKLGPVWDFDTSSGNMELNKQSSPGDWWIRSAESVWINRLFQDPSFQKKAYDRWNELKENEIETLLSFIDGKANELASSQKQNFNKWPILNSWVWPNAVITGSYEGEIEYFKTFLKKRIDWIDFQINQPDLKSFTLLSPNDNDRFIIENQDDSLLHFTWEPSLPGVTYKWILRNDDSNSTPPLLSVQSNGFGFDQQADVNMSDINSVLISLNVKKGDSINLNWAAVAKGVTHSILSTPSFTLNFVRKRLLSDFNLTTPADNAEISVNTASENSIEPIVFSWQPSNGATNYRMSITDEASDRILYQSPLLSSRSSFVLPAGEQIRFFSEFYRQKVINTTWQVEAFEAEDSIISKPFRLQFNNVVNQIAESASALSDIYPNPGNGKFFIPTHVPNCRVLVRDVRGMPVGDFHLDEKGSVDLSHLSPGLYIVHVDQGVSSYRRKLIINK